MQDRNIATTFAKGMEVLAAFDGQTPAMTLADLARRTGQDRAAVRRAALTLVQLGYLRQQDRSFALTTRVLALAGGFLQANHFGRNVQPVLNRHASNLGAEVTLATRDGDAVLLLAQSTLGPGPVSYGFTLGSHLPLLHTSLGRMLLACDAETKAAATIRAAACPRHTPNSLTDPDQILDRVNQARRDGYVVTDGEFEVGIIGFAVALSKPGQTGVVIGSSAPRGRNEQRDVDAVLRALQLCAAELRQSGSLQNL